MTDVYDLGMPKRRVPNTAKLIELLQERFPEHSWDKMGVMKGRFGLQRRLELAVTSLFPVHIPLVIVNFGINVL